MSLRFGAGLATTGAGGGGGAITGAVTGTVVVAAIEMPELTEGVTSGGGT
jgi:hypothetical protein